jgi:hypothetical protein
MGKRGSRMIEARLENIVMVGGHQKIKALEIWG